MAANDPTTGGIKCECFTGVACPDKITGECRCLAAGSTCEGSTKNYNTPIPQTTATNIFDFTNILNWIKAHPYIVAGSAILILWMLFARRGRR